MHTFQAIVFIVLPLCLAALGYDVGNTVHEKLETRQYGGGPGGGDEDPYSGTHRWIPASQIRGASRTSCPFLNTAANHGFLPRDGRQISVAQFEQAIVDSLNFSPDFAKTITITMLTKLGVITNDSVQDDALRLDLVQTNVHDKTEHDASISRFDLSQGDNAHVQISLVQDFLDDSMPMGFEFLNTSSVGRTRVRRERESLALGNPPLSEVFFTSSQGEAALILLIMGDDNGPVTKQTADYRNCPKERIRSWLLTERFPTAQGFKRPKRQIEASENGALVEEIAKWQASMDGSPVFEAGGEKKGSDSEKKGAKGAKGSKTNGYYVTEAAFGAH